MTELNNQQIVELAKQVKLKTLSNLIKKAKAEESLSPADLKVLTELQAEFSEKSEPEPTYENRAEALKELKSQGYKIGKSKFYKDCSDGICKIEPDGQITESSLKRYTKHPRANLKRLDKITEEETGKEKTKAEIEKLHEQIAKLRLEREVMEAKYISREDFELEVASRCVAFKTGIEYMIESQSADWILSVFGQYDSERTRLLREAVLGGFEEQFNQFARMDRFEIEFQKTEDG